MAIEQKRSVGSESSITSIASESIRECSLNENHETTADVSGVPLKVRKPYTISKQREKWTEDEHQRFIEAIKLYGRSWRQIEEYIGTKSAVQIRSHAQKFFSKVRKEGHCSAEASIESIEIPPPRPKRKPLHPYPRKQPFPLVENGTSDNMKISDREAHSPISVLSPEGSQVSAPRTSSGSNEEDLSLTLHLSGTSPDDSILMSPGKTLMNIKSPTNEGVALVKSIKLFGHIVGVPEQSEYSDSTNNQLTNNNILKLSKSFSCTGSNSNSLNEVKNGEANLESVDSRMESSHYDKLKKGIYAYKRCLSDQEAVYTRDDRERRRIRVYL